MIRNLILILILFPFISLGQSSSNSKPWSEKAKEEFYNKYNYQQKSKNDKKVIDCLFDKVSHKFSSLRKAEKSVKYLPKTMETCSLLVYVPITGQLSKEQEEFLNVEMLDLVNKFRNKIAKRSELKSDPELDQAAKLQSDYNAAINDLSHLQSNNIPYSTPVRRVSMIKTGNYKAQYIVGENATYTYIDFDKTKNSEYLNELASEMFESWKASKGHRENMQNMSYKYFGFAVTIRKDSGIIYAIQVFQGE
jgi:uncharacterized protein YkwD